MPTRSLVLLGLALTACAGAGPQDSWKGSTPQPDPAVTETDAEGVLEEVAIAVLRVAPAVDSLWPGVWRPERRIVLSPVGAGSLLLGPYPRGFRGRVEPAEARGQLPHPLRQRLWMLPGVTLSVLFTFDLPLGDERVFGTSFIPTLTHFDDPKLATTVLLYHELFHWHQDRAFASAEIDIEAMFDEIGAWPIAPEDVEEQRRAVERELLIKALKTESEAESLAHLTEYYRQLEFRLPRALRAGEEYSERIEGTATYFSYQAAARALSLPEADVLRFLLRDLANTYPEVVGRDPDGLESWHMYAAGAAKTMLVSRFVADWQAKVAGGRTLDGLLLEALERTR